MKFYQTKSIDEKNRGFRTTVSESKVSTNTTSQSRRGKDKVEVIYDF